MLFLSGAFEPLELKTLDHRFRQSHEDRKPSDEILIVTIDQNSIDYLKNRLDIYWKWPRDVYAHTINYLSSSGSRAILLDFDFSDPDINRAEFEEGETDRMLGEAIENAGNVINMALFYREPLGGEFAEDRTDYETLTRFSIDLDGADHIDLTDDQSAVTPIPAVLGPSMAIGTSNVSTDQDGIIRRLELFKKLKGNIYPHSSLALAAHVKGETRLVISPTLEMKLGKDTIRLSPSGAVYLNWYGHGGPEGGTFKYIPIADVLLSELRVSEGAEPLVSREEFRDKIVLIGSNAPSLYDLKPTPFSRYGAYPGVEIVATSVNNLLDGSTIQRSGRWTTVTLTFFACVMAALMVSAVKSVYKSIAITVGLMAAAYFSTFRAFSGNIFIDMVPPVSGIALSFVVVTVINYLTEGKEKRWVKRAFSQYISSSVMEEVLDHPEKLRLGGERKELSVLFSDIRGFTSISERLEPGQLTGILNEYLTPMTDIVFRHGGTLDKYIGDAVMAFFGAPLHLENHPGEACGAALEMMEGLEVLRQRWHSGGMPAFVQEMKIGVGINTGLVSVGNMGSESRFDYTVIGDHVNLASRLEGSTKYYGVGIIVSESTRRMAGGDFVFRELDLIRVVGKNIPIRIFELVKRSEGGSNGKLLESIGIFEHALHLFRERRWDEALMKFREFSLDKGPDKPSKIFMERCLRLKSSPPPEDWDGVYERSEK